MVDLSAFHLAPETSLLVINDMQNEFCKPDGRHYTPSNAAAIPQVQKLLERARQMDIPIIFVQTVLDKKDPALTLWNYERISPEDTWNAQIVDELRPGEVNEFIVRKSTHDPFYGTDLDNILQSLVPRPTEHYAVVTGVVSNVSLWHAIEGFHLRDYWTVLPFDCSGGQDEIHEETMARWETWGFWNVFATYSDMLTFGPTGSGSRKVSLPDGPGRVLHDQT